MASTKYGSDAQGHTPRPIPILARGCPAEHQERWPSGDNRGAAKRSVRSTGGCSCRPIHPDELGWLGRLHAARDIRQRSRGGDCELSAPESATVFPMLTACITSSTAATAAPVSATRLDRRKRPSAFLDAGRQDGRSARSGRPPRRPEAPFLPKSTRDRATTCASSQRNGVFCTVNNIH